MTEHNKFEEGLAGISGNAAEEYDALVVLTKDHLTSVSHYADETFKLKLQQSTLADDIKAFAKANGFRPADVKDMVNIILKERDKGGTLSERERKLEIAREIVDKLGAKA